MGAIKQIKHPPEASMLNAIQTNKNHMQQERNFQLTCQGEHMSLCNMRTSMIFMLQSV